MEFENRVGKAMSFLAGILVALAGIFLFGQVEELSDISNGNVVSRNCSYLSKNTRSKYSRSCPTISVPTLDILPQCFNGSVWMGEWELNRSLVKPGARTPADEDLARRYHSKFESSCNMTDILRLSINEMISGHVNDASELAVLERMKGLRGQTLLQIGTSVDNRLLRFGCPVFGTKRNVYKEGDIAVSECQIPLIDFTMVYAFNDALTKAHVSVEEQGDHLKKIDELMSQHGIQSPRYIVLSGIEWDMKWHKDHKEQFDWNYTELVVDEKVSLLRRHYPSALALFLRTQPYTSGKEGSLASKESFQRYNDLFYATARHHNPNENICGGVHVADLAEMMLYNGTAESGWSDGVHPSGWVSLQFMNVLLNVVSLMGELCRS
ncbi:unnamed protein product [Cylindrotheca closterium]|uniref:Uncharacterized protein n=1 Tax=Cylindrotheca closterium TaxID=2856 RepID=A0AAD2G2K4_9STRA|nr:unnamed protein product [Cylindrotheca closterium]